MMKQRKFTPEFKANVANEALRGDRTIQEIAMRERALKKKSNLPFEIYTH